ncbi:PH domain-containing protein [Nonomuraea fuscirosea]|uniref:PH domain-containing protein n=1 Tax=Nonomuraea fuscirosea TaxID=1291556 RepID=UPI0033CFAD54
MTTHRRTTARFPAPEAEPVAGAGVGVTADADAGRATDVGSITEAGRVPETGGMAEVGRGAGAGAGGGGGSGAGGVAGVGGASEVGGVAEAGGGGWRRLAGRSPWASGVKSLAVVVGAVAGVVRFLSGRDWPFWGVVGVCAGVAVLIVAGAAAYDVLRLRAARWRLTPERLELRSGVTTRRHRSLPRDRVRSVDLRADPVRRMFGLTVVKVGTGEQAGDDTELVLDSLGRREAESLRRVLLHQGEPAERADGSQADRTPVGGTRADRLAAHETLADGTSTGETRADRLLADGTRVDGLVAELRWSWVRYAPLSVWTFTGAAVVLGALYKALDAFGLKKVTGRLAAGVWDWVVTLPLLAVPVLLAANLLVGVLGAGLLFAESWGGYRLEREPGRLRVRRGLLTSRSLTLEERRLRGVEISEPLLLRLGGGARVRTVATGLSTSGGDESEDASALTPPLPRALAMRIAALVAGAGLPALTPHPPAARRRRIVRAVVTAVVTALVTALAAVLTRALGTPPLPGPATGVAGGAAPVDGRMNGQVAGWLDGGVGEWVWGWVWVLPVVVLAFGLWLAVAGAASLGHALSSRHLVIRRGAVARRTVALERRGIAGWTITESYFQRRAGLLTVRATTAAGKGHYEVVDVGHGDGLDLADRAVPGLLAPFLSRRTSARRR